MARGRSQPQRSPGHRNLQRPASGGLPGSHQRSRRGSRQKFDLVDSKHARVDCQLLDLFDLTRRGDTNLSLVLS